MLSTGTSTILAVVEAPTPELTHSASAALYQKLAGDKQHFESSQPLGSGEFFEKNAFLFLPKDQVAHLTGQFEQAAPLIEIMAGDPSLARADGRAGNGAGRRQARSDQARQHRAAPQSNLPDDRGRAEERQCDILLARTAQRQASAPTPTGAPFIEFKPILDFNALEPGKAATDAIRQAASDINLASQYGATGQADRPGADRQ